LTLNIRRQRYRNSRKFRTTNSPKERSHHWP